MEILRTPEHCFDAIGAALPPPRYVTISAGDADDLAVRMAYVDDGPREAPRVLLLHGEPTWSYLYRTILADLRAAGLRVIAPDLIGFGRSDKPAWPGAYSYRRHVDWMLAFVRTLGSGPLHLVCQDWGGLIGLRLVGEHPGLFASVVAMNTALPTGGGTVPAEFLAWRRAAADMPIFAVSRIVQTLCARPLPAPVMAAYDAPFPDESYKVGARVFPALVPIDADDPDAIANRAAWESLARFDRPFLTLFGDGDPMTRGNERAFQKKIPGARGQPHAVLPGVGHFIQEDASAEVAWRILSFLGA